MPSFSTEKSEKNGSVSELCLFEAKYICAKKYKPVLNVTKIAKCGFSRDDARARAARRIKTRITIFYQNSFLLLVFNAHAFYLKKK